jgi:thiol-disulfide isomerase/thioredoxin
MNPKKILIAAGLITAIAIGRYVYFLPSLSSGMAPPDFEATLPGGEPFRLSSLQDKYVLLHFWGSWCGPCRKENPELRAIYEQYQHKNFTIVSVAIEKDPARWERARTQDGLPWPYHILELTSSFRFFDAPVAVQFGVKKLPTLFLLAPGGQIVLVDPGLEKLREKLAGL